MLIIQNNYETIFVTLVRLKNLHEVGRRSVFSCASLPGFTVRIPETAKNDIAVQILFFKLNGKREKNTLC